MGNRTEITRAVGGTGGKVSDKALKSFVVKDEKGRKLANGGGLYLFLRPSGGAAWRVKYLLEGKEKTYSVSLYPGWGLQPRGWNWEIV